MISMPDIVRDGEKCFIFCFLRLNMPDIVRDGESRDRLILEMCIKLGLCRHSGSF